jgi:hypothetical protein
MFHPNDAIHELTLERPLQERSCGQSAESGWKKGKHVLNLPNQGSPKANWKQNSSALREAESSGTKIRDASTDMHGNVGDNTGFTRAERNLLENRGREYDPSTREWKR